MCNIKRIFFALLIFCSGAFVSADSKSNEDSNEAYVARTQVEHIIIDAYKEVLESQEVSNILLTNAPISETTNKRGSHLLSFAAFNQFPNLAQWGIDNGANINLSDQDRATMLRMALGNYDEIMARFALKQGASPNIEMGLENDTLLGGLLNWKWLISGFELAQEFQAQPHDEQERQKILHYLEELNNNTSLYTYMAHSPLLEKNIPSVKSGQLISIDMNDVIDQAILMAIKSGELSQNTMANFLANGKNFEKFLAFNGFTKSLVERLQYMDTE